ncbi:hypothetical protein VYU27_005066 [Nannochloropsis oceanica]
MVSLALGLFSTLQLKTVFTLLLVPFLGWYSSRVYSLLTAVGFCLFQCLPIALRLDALFTGRVTESSIKVLYSLCILLECFLVRLAFLFVLQLRQCRPVELSLLRTVYQSFFQDVERQAEGRCAW